MCSNAQNTQVGQRWKVAWRDGTIHLAEIVEIRKPEDTPTNTATTANPGHGHSISCGVSASTVVTVGSTENGRTGSRTGASPDGEVGGHGGLTGAGVGGSVYVHYVDFDRRLDEWVGMDRVDLAAGQQKSVAANHGDKRRVTTRMKREFMDGSRMLLVMERLRRHRIKLCLAVGLASGLKLLCVLTIAFSRCL